MQIRSELRKLLRKVANNQRGKQTNNDDYISSLAEVIKGFEERIEEGEEFLYSCSLCNNRSASAVVADRGHKPKILLQYLAIHNINPTIK